VVTLSKIYTKSGDGGTTRLGNGEEVPKTDPRVEAYGTVDELNAVLGLVLAARLSPEQHEIVQLIQHDLFDLGADLCHPPKETAEEASALRVGEDQVLRLESTIDALNESLQPLRSFVLPGGTTAATWLHLARTVCRRAERRIWDLAGGASVNEQVPRYLNRLSDLLFVMARHHNQAASGDLLWEPAKGRTAGPDETSSSR
jgi:cob(I)alamin adenosyltransferase